MTPASSAAASSFHVLPKGLPPRPPLRSARQQQSRRDDLRLALRRRCPEAAVATYVGIHDRCGPESVDLSCPKVGKVGPCVRPVVPENLIDPIGAVRSWRADGAE